MSDDKPYPVWQLLFSIGMVFTVGALALAGGALFDPKHGPAWSEAYGLASLALLSFLAAIGVGLDDHR